MNIDCDIKLECSTKKEAETIKQALTVDDDIFVESRVNDTIIDAHIHAENLSSLLHTLDDYLACASVAEKVIKKK